MICPHCNTVTPETQLGVRAIEGGRAYAQLCMGCGHVLGIRPHTAADPPIAPLDLTQQEIDRLRFVQWRLRDEIRSHTSGPDDTSPLTAA